MYVQVGLLMDFAQVFKNERAHRLKRDYAAYVVMATLPFCCERVREDKRVAPNGDATLLRGVEKVNAVRSVVPAITHVDYSARVQTVDAERHGRYYELLKAFERRTGCPVIINTSFNLHEEPIVRSPEEAVATFRKARIDALAIGPFLVAA